MKAEARPKSRWAGITTVGAALLAHLPCCGLPAMLGLGGVSSASGWMASLEPWRLHLIGFSLLMAGLTVFGAFKPRVASCGCCTKKIEPWKKWAAVALAGLAIGSAAIQVPAYLAADHSGHAHAQR
jgi:hypothetical protein